MGEPNQAIDARTVSINEILVDEDFNCRGLIAPMDVIELANDIEEHGLLQPVTIMIHNEEETAVTGKPYCLIAGFRRTAAYNLKKWKDIPAVIKTWMSPHRRKIINLSENIQRTNLNILEEARALKHLHDMGVPRLAVAAELKKSGKWVQVRYYLLELPEEIQQEAAAGLLNQHQIFALRKMETPKEQFEAVKKVKDAQARGHAAPEIDKKKRPKKGHKIHRSRAAIQEMMVELNDLGLPHGYWSRCLSWASGEISDTELMQSTHQHAVESGHKFTIPAKYHPD